MDVMVVAEDATTWRLTDLLGRSMGTVVQETKGFLIVPAGEAMKTMGAVHRGPHSTLDAALAEIETRTRGVCRRSAS
jgi:hypothetical protein